MTPNELIEELERAESGDSRLDFWIWWWGNVSSPRGDRPAQEFVEEKLRSAEAPRYSSNIDAAATLVPEGYRWSLEQLRDRFAASVHPPVGRTTAQVTEARAAAPALCAAVLRTRICFVNDVMRGRH